MKNDYPSTTFQGIEEVVNFGWNNLNAVRKINGLQFTDKELFFAGAGFLFDIVVKAAVNGQTTESLQLYEKLGQELMLFNEHFNLKFQRPNPNNSTH